MFNRITGSGFFAVVVAALTSLPVHACGGGQASVSVPEVVDRLEVFTISQGRSGKCMTPSFKIPNTPYYMEGAVNTGPVALWVVEAVRTVPLDGITEVVYIQSPRVKTFADQAQQAIFISNLLAQKQSDAIIFVLEDGVVAKASGGIADESCGNVVTMRTEVDSSGRRVDRYVRQENKEVVISPCVISITFLRMPTRPKKKSTERPTGLMV